MGIEQNIVTHCLTCHRLYDNYDPGVRKKTMEYVMECYPDWEKERVIYKKWMNNESYKR